MEIGPLIASGDIALHQISPAEMSPGEFTALVCRGVNERNPTVVVIDKHGVVRDVAIGYDATSAAHLEGAVRQLLAEP